MNGQYMGSLSVKLQTASTGKQRLLKPALSGNKGNQWFSEKITFSSAQDYMVSGHVTAIFSNFLLQDNLLMLNIYKVNYYFKY
jgi:5'(3')-deoxyribonucleotidase